ncbi:CopD family protein [Paenibacillus sp. TRM 82003]|nr:CopD family protein [Paenibacillus sp. TRM 82003]
MTIYAILFVLYVALAAVVAFAYLRFLPAGKAPALRVPPGAEAAAVGLVALAALASAAWTAREWSASFDAPFPTVALQVLQGTSQGVGLLGALLFAALWYGADALAPHAARRWLFLLAAAGLAVSTAAATHAATLSTAAFLAQAAHLLAVSAWLGGLLVVGWFAAPPERAAAGWRSFYGWYTPLAVACVVIVVATGFVLMDAFSNAYVSAWTLDYGQVLLLKHLLFVPLLAFAAVNGLWIGPKAKRAGAGEPGGFDPRPWLRAESVIALALFAASAALSRQAPPHNLEETLLYTPLSPWFLRWVDKPIAADVQLTLQPGATSLLLGALALAFLAIVPLAYARRVHPSLAVCAALLFAALGYAALMTAVA